MAFTGVPVVTSLGKRQNRITGVSLAAGASGTIKVSGGGGDASLASTFPYDTTNGFDLTKVLVNHAAAPAGGTPLVSVAKSGGPPTDTITLTNEDGVNATGALEIFVEEVHSINK